MHQGDYLRLRMLRTKRTCPVARSPSSQRQPGSYDQVLALPGAHGLSQHPPHHTGKPPTWQAGHVIDHDPASPLAPEASTCNTSAGATYGNARREPRSEDW
jgi:hypothetical protein